MHTTCLFTNITFTDEWDDDIPGVIDIEPITDEVLGVDQEFKFRCNASADWIISLLVDDSFDSGKLSRISNVTDPKENAIVFTFSNTTVYDNGTNFTCAATDLDSNFTSNFSTPLILQIECTWVETIIGSLCLQQSV